MIVSENHSDSRSISPGCGLFHINMNKTHPNRAISCFILLFNKEWSDSEKRRNGDSLLSCGQSVQDAQSNASLNRARSVVKRLHSARER